MFTIHDFIKILALTKKKYICKMDEKKNNNTYKCMNIIIYKNFKFFFF